MRKIWLHRHSWKYVFFGNRLACKLKCIYWLSYKWLCKHSRLWHYGLSSFSSRGTKLERFLPQDQHTQRKLLKLENWCSGEVSKSAKVWLSKSIFYVKKHRNLSQFFFIEKYQFRSTFLLLTFFDKINF